MSLLKFTTKGIYCPPADVFIDPWRKVDKALITHGHSDHASRGHNRYICTHSAAPTIKHRLGKINISSVEFGEEIRINGVRFSFHPAGHIVGSAQIRVEHKGEVWVASGDYKIEDDNLTEPFEVVKCHHFITECTFGLPFYQWSPQADVFCDINDWWANNRDNGITSILFGYSLGKSQRLIQNVDHSIGPVYTHPSIEAVNEVIRNQGVKLKPTTMLEDQNPSDLKGSLIVTPQSASGSWISKLDHYATASASGWMMLKKVRKSREIDRGFVLSDHADWEGLLSTIKATGAQNVYATHGSTKIFGRHLEELGYNISLEDTAYEVALGEDGGDLSE